MLNKEKCSALEKIPVCRKGKCAHTGFMLIGTLKTKLRNDRSVELPTNFLPYFFEGGVITKGIEQQLYLYPANEWDSFYAHLSRLPVVNKVARRLQQHMFGSAEFVALRNNCIVIPEDLLKYAQIVDILIVAGVGSHAELSNEIVWASFWDKAPQEMAEFFSQIEV